MSLFKNILIDAEDCGYAGMSSGDTYVFLKDKYSFVDFNGDDFRYNGKVYDAWDTGRGAYMMETGGVA